MVALIVVALLIALLFGAGFAVEFLWWIAIAVLAIWLIGFLMRGAERTWYRW